MKPLKLDADSSRTGKLEDMNAPWSRLLHLATRYTYPKRYPLVLAGDAMFDFYYLAKGAPQDHARRGERTRTGDGLYRQRECIQ